jgi:hypothetical protein
MNPTLTAYGPLKSYIAVATAMTTGTAAILPNRATAARPTEIEISASTHFS